MTGREWAEKVLALFKEMEADGCQIHWHWSEVLHVAREEDADDPVATLLYVYDVTRPYKWEIE